MKKILVKIDLSEAYVYSRRFNSNMKICRWWIDGLYYMVAEAIDGK